MLSFDEVNVSRQTTISKRERARFRCLIRDPDAGTVEFIGVGEQGDGATFFL
jgi:hypothetical protein